MKTCATIMLAAMLTVLACATVLADTSPLANRIIVEQALQNQMQTQLNTQAVELRSQQDLTRLSLQNQLQQEILQLQYLQLQQQLNLNNVRMNAVGPASKARSSKSHKAPKRSH